MSEWQPIDTLPDGDASVLVHVPNGPPDGRKVFEAIARRDGRFYDPVYDEWDGFGATHWMPLPEPPK